jgi:dTDP-4-dehydrorhamnose reductase
MKLLITGASGRLGRYVLREARVRGLDVIAWSGRQSGEVSGYRLHPVSMKDPAALRRHFREANPDAFLNIAALAKVDECRQDPWSTAQINSIAPVILAALTALRCRFVQVSTDMVFGGDRAPYRETAETAPLSEYGRSKARAEQALAQFPAACIARVSLLYGPSLGDPPNFFDQLLETFRNRQPFKLFTDEFRTPLSLPAAARGLLDLATSDRTGVWHISGPERISRFQFGQKLARYLGQPNELVQPMSRLESPAIEPRPADLSLDSTKFRAAFPQWQTVPIKESFAELGIAQP